jgi:hypothetical protein
VDGIPITGIDPALVSVARAFIPSPQSISRTPVRTKGDSISRGGVRAIRPQFNTALNGTTGWVHGTRVITRSHGHSGTYAWPTRQNSD